ncbi:TIGR03668 family PPOX class F420-dependent oxidoreductase [Actinomycetospora cinnamomea]|uniref:PPOX class probable F420-dependent enzyme n=1 Tax=Actinomycetospora cinnamomea TaxID=663609 RepID=A0A2U1F9L4_9PSEU|nr:TIGR03668 family PPOX class F420-dependent oxidoreductase [Actinomycetospora cinnamomea]PVZ08872.1 PPOX class probable F420-dependent enzyme [Actinomycetospora cinnamomea]
MPTLDADDARGRFAAARVARLATVSGDGQPHVVPVVFAVDEDTVLIAVDAKPKRHRGLKRLRNIGENPAVSLLVDSYSDDWSALWWVRADGTATVSDAEPLLARARDALGARYPQHREQPPEGPAIVVEVARWTGWSAS